MQIKKSTKRAGSKTFYEVWIIRLIIALGFCLPFERIPSRTVAGFTLKISVLIGATLILLVLLNERGRPQPRRIPALLWFIAGFGIWYTIRFIGVTDQKSALKIYLPMLFLVSVSVAIGRSWNYVNLNKVVKWILYGAIASAVFGLYQFAGDAAGLPRWATGIRMEYAADRFGFPRLQSTALEPLFYGNYLLLPLSLSLALLAYSKRKIIRSQPAMIAVVGLLVLVDLLTVSRGAILSTFVLFVVLATLLIIDRKKNSINLRKIFLMSGGMIVTLIVIIMVALTVVSVKGKDSDNTYGTTGFRTWLSHLRDTRLTPSNDNKQKDDSISQRASARDQLIRTMQKRPISWIVGFGPGQYAQAEKDLEGLSYGDPNNVALRLLADGGVVALGLFVGMVLSALLYLWKKLRSVPRSLERAIAMALIGYLLAWGLQAQSFGGLVLTHFWYVIGIILAMQLKEQGDAVSRSKSGVS